MIPIQERVLDTETAEVWIRETLSLHPDGATLRVTGGCMEPALKEGSVVTLSLPRRDARVGDIALVKTARGLRLHRIVIAFRDTLRTKGDRSIYFDAPIRQTDVIGLSPSSEGRARRSLRVALSLFRTLVRHPESSRAGMGAMS